MKFKLEWSSNDIEELASIIHPFGHVKSSRKVILKALSKINSLFRKDVLSFKDTVGLVIVLRTLLENEDSLVRASTIRCLRSTIKSETHVRLLNRTRVHFFIIRSILRDEQFVLERMEALKLIKRMIYVVSSKITELSCEIYPESGILPSCLVQSLVSIANLEVDALSGVCLETLRILCHVCPVLVAQNDGFKAFISATLVPSLEPMRKPLLLTIQYLLSDSYTRKLFRPSLDFGEVFCLFTDEAPFKKLEKISESERKREKKQFLTTLDRGAYVLRFLFNTWPGLLIFSADPSCLKSLLFVVEQPVTSFQKTTVLALLVDLVFSGLSSSLFLPIRQNLNGNLQQKKKNKGQGKQVSSLFLQVFHKLSSLEAVSFERRRFTFIDDMFSRRATSDDQVRQSIILLALSKLGLFESLIELTLNEESCLSLMGVEVLGLLLRECVRSLPKTLYEEYLSFAPVFSKTVDDNEGNEVKKLEAHKVLKELIVRVGIERALSIKKEAYKRNLSSFYAFCAEEQVANRFINCETQFVPLVTVSLRKVDLTVMQQNYSMAKARAISISNKSELVTTSFLEQTGNTGSKARKSFMRFIGTNFGVKKLNAGKDVSSSKLRKSSLVEHQNLKQNPTDFNPFLFRSFQDLGHLIPLKRAIKVDRQIQNIVGEDNNIGFIQLGEFNRMVNSCKVLTTKDWKTWNWFTIYEMSFTVLKNVYYLHQLMKTKFFKRIFGVFRLSFDVRATNSYTVDGDYILCYPWAADNLPYFRVLNQIITVLLQNKEGIKFLLKDRRGNIIVQLMTLLKRRTKRANNSMEGNVVSIDDDNLFVITRIGINEYTLNCIFWIFFPFTSLSSGVTMLNDLGFPFIFCEIAKKEQLDFLAYEILKNMNYFNCTEARNCLAFALLHKETPLSLKKCCLNLIYAVALVAPDTLAEWIVDLLSTVILESKTEQLVIKTYILVTKLLKIHEIVEVFIRHYTKYRHILVQLLEKSQQSIPLSVLQKFSVLENTPSSIVNEFQKVQQNFFNPKILKPKDNAVVQSSIKLYSQFITSTSEFKTVTSSIYSTLLQPWTVKLWIIFPTGLKKEVESTCYISVTRDSETNKITLVANPSGRIEVATDAYVYASCCLGGIVIDSFGEFEEQPKYQGFFPLKRHVSGSNRSQKPEFIIKEVDFNVSPRRRVHWDDRRWFKCTPEERLKALEVETNLDFTGDISSIKVSQGASCPASFSFIIEPGKASKSSAEKIDEETNHYINPLFTLASSEKTVKTKSSVKEDNSYSSDSDSEDDDISVAQQRLMQNTVVLGEVTFSFEILCKDEVSTDEEEKTSATMIQRRMPFQNWKLQLRWLFEYHKLFLLKSKKGLNPVIIRNKLQILNFIDVIGKAGTNDLGVKLIEDFVSPDIWKVLSDIAYGSGFLDAKIAAMKALNSLAQSDYCKRYLQAFGWNITLTSDNKLVLLPKSLEKFFSVLDQDESISIWNRLGQPIEGFAYVEELRNIKCIAELYTDLKTREEIGVDPGMIHQQEAIIILKAIANLSNHITHSEAHKTLLNLYNTNTNAFKSPILYIRARQYLSRYKYEVRVCNFVLNLFHRCLDFDDIKTWIWLDSVRYC